MRLTSSSEQVKIISLMVLIIKKIVSNF